MVSYSTVEVYVTHITIHIGLLFMEASAKT